MQEEITDEINTTEVATTEVATTEVVEVDTKNINDLYEQNVHITYLLMGIVAILIIAIITRRK